MTNNITKTILSSLEKFRSLYVRKEKPEGVSHWDTGEQQERFFLQSQIRLIESWIAKMKVEIKRAKKNRKKTPLMRDFYIGKDSAFEDQISSLEDVKKELLNNN